jgi:hypothetical protein
MNINYLPYDILGVITDEFDLYDLLNVELISSNFFSIMSKFLWEYHINKLCNTYRYRLDNVSHCNKILFVKLYNSYIDSQTADKGFINNHFCMSSLERLWLNNYCTDINKRYYTNKGDLYYLFINIFMTILYPGKYRLFIYIKVDNFYNFTIFFKDRTKQKDILCDYIYPDSLFINKWFYMDVGLINIVNSNSKHGTKYKLEVRNIDRDVINSGGLQISHALILPNNCNILEYNTPE